MDPFAEFEFGSPTKPKTFKKTINVDVQVDELDATQFIQDTQSITQESEDEDQDQHSKATDPPPPLLLSGASFFSKDPTGTKEDHFNDAPPPLLATNGVSSFLFSDIVKKAKRRLDGGEPEDEEKDEEKEAEDTTQVIQTQTQTQVIGSSQLADTQLISSPTQPQPHSARTKSKSTIEDDEEEEDNKLISTLKDTTQKYVDNYEEQLLKEKQEANQDSDADDHEANSMFEVSQNKPMFSSRTTKPIFTDDEDDEADAAGTESEAEAERGLDHQTAKANVRFAIPSTQFQSQTETETETQVIETSQTDPTLSESQLREQRLQKLTEQKRQLRLLKEQAERDKDLNRKELSNSIFGGNEPDQDQDSKPQKPDLKKPQPDSRDGYHSEDEDLEFDGIEELQATVEPVDTKAFFDSLGVDFSKREFKTRAVASVREEKRSKKVIPVEEEDDGDANGDSDEEGKDKSHDSKPEPVLITLSSDSEDSDEITALERFNVALKFSNRSKKHTTQAKNKPKSKNAKNQAGFNIRELLKLSREQEKKKLESSLNRKMLRDIERINQEFKESDDILEDHFRKEKIIKDKEKKQRLKKKSNGKNAGNGDDEDEEEDDDYLDDEESMADNEEVPDSDFSEEEEEEELEEEQAVAMARPPKRDLSELLAEGEEDEIAYEQDSASSRLAKALKVSEQSLIKQESLLKRRRVNVIEDDDEEDESTQPSLADLTSFEPLKLKLSSMTGPIQIDDLQTISQLFDQASQAPAKARNTISSGKGAGSTDIFAQLRTNAQQEKLHSEESFIQNDGATQLSNTGGGEDEEEEKSMVLDKLSFDSGFLSKRDTMNGAVTDDDLDIDMAEQQPIKIMFNTQDLMGSTSDQLTQIDYTQVDSTQVDPTQAQTQAQTQISGDTQTKKPMAKPQRIKIQLSDDEEEDYPQTVADPVPATEHEPVSESESDDEEKRIKMAEFYKLQRQQEQANLAKQRQDRKKKGLDQIMEDQAEESEDEFAGLGGVDGEHEDLDIANSEDEAIYDDVTKVDQSRAEYVAKHVEQDLQKDLQMNKALLNAIESGVGLANFDFRDPEQALRLLKRENKLKQVAKIMAVREKYQLEMENKKKAKALVMDQEDEFKDMLDANAEVIPDSSDEEVGNVSQTTVTQKSTVYQKKSKSTYEYSDSDSDQEADTYLSQRTDSTTSLDTVNTTLRSFAQKYRSFTAPPSKSTKSISLSNEENNNSDSGLIELSTTRVHRLTKLPTLKRDPNEVIITTTSKSFGARGASIMSLGKSKSKSSTSQNKKPNMIGRVLKADSKLKKSKTKNNKIGNIVSSFKGFKKDDGFE